LPGAELRSNGLFGWKGWTPRQDLVDPRLHKSSVTDIAFSWAFNDAAHFSRWFSKAYGVAPKAYRAAHLRRPLKRT
jgi:AraC-like DNA-binding protein